jgi:hypothetical protein
VLITLTNDASYEVRERNERRTAELKGGELAGWQDPRSSDPNCKDVSNLHGAEPVLPGNWPARAQGTTATCSSTATAHQRGTAQQAVRLGPLAWSSSNTRTSRCQGDYHHTRLSLLSARQ